MEKIFPKKSLGQNFLVDKNISRKIVETFDIKLSDIILEIGCGTGALTEQLLNKHPAFLFSIDIDQRAVDTVRQTLSKNELKNFEIIHSDIREIIISDLTKQKKLEAGRIKVIGNIPYNISADILFWIFAQCNLIEKAVIMMQKEVAQRLTAKPNNKSYGITTVALNLIGECKALFNVSSKCFYPVPKVTSTVVEITPIYNKYSDIDFNKIMILVKSAFNQRRKVLRNALSDYITSRTDKQIIESLPIEISHFLSLRAEQLTTKDFIKLYRFFNEIKI